MAGVLGMAAIGLVAAGAAFAMFEIVLGDYIYWMKCSRWCRRHGLECQRVDTKGGEYGYVGFDRERVRWYMIPEDFGDLDERMSIGHRMREFSWNGTDRKAVEKDGTETSLEYKDRR